MKNKTANCENCSPESIFDAKTNSNDYPVWECRCCGNQISRRVLNTKKKQDRKENKSMFDNMISELLAV